MKETEGIYLHEELKAKYKDDFINNVLKCERSSTHKLDEGLAKILEKINENKNIQTLYSCRYFPKENLEENEIDTRDYESYLEFCYSEAVWTKLKNELLPKLEADFTLLADEKGIWDMGCINYMEEKPRDNPNMKYKPNIGSSITSLCSCGAFNDINYFRVNHIRVTLTSKHIELYEELNDFFWGFLKDNLSKI